MKNNIEKTENFIHITSLIAIVLCVVCFFSSQWIAETWFSYEKTKTKEVREPYQYVIDTIYTYECYTTTYGKCYHAGYCGYLWNSAHKTTVYEAQKRGYTSCSKCTPNVETTYKITETRYKTVTKTVTDTEVPSEWVTIGGCVVFGVLWVVVTTPARIKLRRYPYEKLLKILEIGANIKNIDDAINRLSVFYIRKGIKIPRELYHTAATISLQKKYENLLKILELGLGVTGIENVKRKLIEFYGRKGINFPKDILR